MLEFTVTIDALARESLGKPLLALPVYLAAGLASSLFPCIYPLIPVTAGFLRTRNREGEKKWKHPLIYWFGTIATYAILGFAAAAGGGSFNRWMQSAPAILLTGVLFLFLCFVMIDYYPLAWQSGDQLFQKTSKKSGASATFFMGMIAGLVASACAAPALVAMLVFLANHAAASHSGIGSWFYGSSLSAAFGIGIGFPLFLAGILGAKLPSSGGWMSAVKYSFAVVIAAAALYQLYKGFLVFGFIDMDIYLILTGLALVIAAAFLGLKPPDTSDRRALTRFVFALLFLIAGASLAFRGLNSPLRFSQQPAQTQIPPERIGNLVFFRDPSAALSAAAEKNKPIFIDFYADWCTNCHEFSALIQKPGNLNTALQDAVLLKIYDTDTAFLSYQENPAYPELQIGLPFFLILSPDGSFRWKGNNYLDSDGMIGALRGKSR